MARKRSQRQIDKNARTREALLHAAMRVVGKLGFARASIGKIVEIAGVSTGTFYLHFKSKEHLYELLLPWANVELSAYLGKRIENYSCYMDFEERNIRGFFDYIAGNAGFLTVLIESEALAPKAWREYTRIREHRYIEILNDAWDAGEFPDYSRSEVPQVCSMLVAMRRAIVTKFFEKRTKPATDPGEVIDTYLEFVFAALHRSNAERILNRWKGAAAAAASPVVNRTSRGAGLAKSAAGTISEH